jgi:hypothetical protein
VLGKGAIGLPEVVFLDISLSTDVVDNLCETRNTFAMLVGPGCRICGRRDVGRFGVTINASAHGFVDASGSFTTIDVPGAVNTNAQSINDAGQIVGIFGMPSVDSFLATPTAIFAGIPGRPNCFGRSVSALAWEYGGLNAAADALNFSSVRAMQKAILEFCED